jgi:hypothetical protein
MKFTAAIVAAVAATGVSAQYNATVTAYTTTIDTTTVPCTGPTTVSIGSKTWVVTETEVCIVKPDNNLHS